MLLLHSVDQSKSKGPAQTQGVENRLVLLIGVSAKSHCNEHRHWKVEKTGAIINLPRSLIPEKTLLWISSQHNTNLPSASDCCCNLLTLCHSSFLIDLSSRLTVTLFSITYVLFLMVSICPKIILLTSGLSVSKFFSSCDRLHPTSATLPYGHTPDFSLPVAHL